MQPTAVANTANPFDGPASCITPSNATSGFIDQLPGFATHDESMFSNNVLPVSGVTTGCNANQAMTSNPAAMIIAQASSLCHHDAEGSILFWDDWLCIMLLSTVSS